MITEAELRESFKARRGEHLRPAPAPEVLPAEPENPLDRHTPEEQKHIDETLYLEGPQAARAVAMRMLGFSILEIANELRVEKRVVERYLHLARTRGRMCDVKDRLTNHLAAKAAEQLEALIDAGNAEAILEVLKGTGFLKTAGVGGGGGGGDAPTILQVNVELPTGYRSTAEIPITGQIAGAPRALGDGDEQG